VSKQRVFGAFVFPDLWNDLASFRSKLLALRDFGINTILTESVDYDASAIDLAHELGFRFFAGVACFSDHATNFAKLAARPELRPILETGEQRPQMEWYTGITPTDHGHQQEILSLIRAITRGYAVDGVFLDFVRWPLHWEIELRPGQARPPDSSFDEATLGRFTEISGIAPPPALHTAAARAAWIHERCSQEWVDFKCGVITAFVEKARAVLQASRVGAELGIFVVPDVDGLTEPLTGQRLNDLAPLADWVAPMLYHNILLQPPTWVGTSLVEVITVAGGKTLPVVQVDSNRDPSLAADWGPLMSVGDWRAVLAEVKSIDRLPGLVAFPGTSLLDDGRGNVLRSMMGG
jgi:hypothetical protein